MIRFATQLAPDATASLDPSPDTDCCDGTDHLADEIAELAAQIHAATFRLLVLVAEFDRREGWGYGFRSCAHWLSWRTGIGQGTAREQVRVARALPELPQISEAMKSGKLSYSKVRALTRVATPDNEADLLEFARNGTAAQVERVVRAWRRVDRNEEAALERARHEARSLRIYPGEGGSWVVSGRLDPEVGALLNRALQAAGEELYREGASPGEGASPEETTHPQRMADAIGLVAERALASEGPVRRADRFQVMLHLDAVAAADPATGPGTLAESGRRVPAGTSRRLSCDASIVQMTHGPKGEVLDVGRRRRTVPPPIRRALERSDASDIRFLRPDRRPIPDVPAVPPLGPDPIGDLITTHREAGIEPGAWSPTPLWNGEPFDLGYAVWVLRGQGDGPAGRRGGSEAGRTRSRGKVPAISPYPPRKIRGKRKATTAAHPAIT